jgi:hypothetical protein
MLKSLTLFSAILLLSAPTFANNVSEPGSVYFGFNVGNADFGIGEDAVEADDFGDVNYTFDDTDIGIQFYAGYQWSQYFAVEASYTDLGETKLSIDLSDSGLTSGSTYEISGSAESSVSAVTKALAIVGNYPINENLFLKAKLGLNAWEISPSSTFDYRLEIPEFNIDESVYETEKLDVESGTDKFWSLGVEYTLDSFSITADYQVFTLDLGDIDLLSAGIKISF